MHTWITYLNTPCTSLYTCRVRLHEQFTSLHGCVLHLHTQCTSLHTCIVHKHTQCTSLHTCIVHLHTHCISLHTCRLYSTPAHTIYFIAHLYKTQPLFWVFPQTCWWHLPCPVTCSRYFCFVFVFKDGPLRLVEKGWGGLPLSRWWRTIRWFIPDLLITFRMSHCFSLLMQS